MDFLYLCTEELNLFSLMFVDALLRLPLELIAAQFAVSLRPFGPETTLQQRID